MRLPIPLTAIEVVESTFRQWDDISPWPLCLVKLAVACGEDSERMAAIAHMALYSLPPAEQAAFLEQYEVPRMILNADYAPIAKVEGQPLSYPTLEQMRVRAWLDKSDLLIKLAMLQLLTPEEAEQAAEGVIPASIAGVMGSLSPEEQLAARIKWRTDSVISRNHPVIVAAAYGMDLTPEQVDELFGIVPPPVVPEEPETSPEPEPEVPVEA